MKNSRFSDSQVIAVLKQAEGGMRIYPPRKWRSMPK
jgi:hypothetical protein